MGQPEGWPILIDFILPKRPAVHQTLQAFARTIFWPALQPKAWANSDIFEITLSMRKMGSECGLVVTIRRATSGLTLEHHE
jgi:hypothetical protein